MNYRKNIITNTQALLRITFASWSFMTMFMESKPMLRYIRTALLVAECLIETSLHFYY